MEEDDDDDDEAEKKIAETIFDSMNPTRLPKVLLRD